MHLSVVTATLLFLTGTGWLSGLNAASMGRVEETDYGKTQGGESVRQFVLRNTNGMTASIISYGCIITAVQAPDRFGVMTNVVLGARSWDQYRKGFNAS